MERRIERRIVNPWAWQDASGFGQATELRGVQRALVCAGRTAVDAAGRPVHPGDLAAQLGQALDNLEAVLGQAGFALADVVRLNSSTTDVDGCLGALGAVGPRLAAAGRRPASTLLGVTRLAFPELLVELEATAAA